MGTCFRNTSCRCSQIHSDDEHGADLTPWIWVLMPTVKLWETLCCNGSCHPAIFEHPRQHQQGTEQVLMMTTGRRWTLSRRERQRQNPNQKGTRTGSTDGNTCKNCGRTGHWMKYCWEVRTTSLTTRKVRAKANMWPWCRRISLPKRPQLSRLFHRHQALLQLFGTIQTHSEKDGS